MSDLAGNDLHVQIRQNRLAKNPALVYSKIFDKIAELGRFGQKTNKGWYDYVVGQRKPQASAEVNTAVISESVRLGLTRRKISDDEIVDRLLLALVNEGAKILEEKVAQRASDIDVVYVAGYGFPAWAGGPMYQADRRGLQDILATMKRFSKGPEYQHSADFWQPAALLCRLTKDGHSFSNI
jgi:3-hydroxyacyl-CoA dehydrogenase